MKRNNSTRMKNIIDIRRERYGEEAKFVLKKALEGGFHTIFTKHRDFLIILAGSVKDSYSMHIPDSILVFLGFPSIEDFLNYYEKK